MNNREFLNSLSDQDFTDWLFDRYAVVEKDPDSLLGYYIKYEGFKYTTLSYINPYLGFLRWLSEERREKNERGK